MKTHNKILIVAMSVILTVLLSACTDSTPRTVTVRVESIDSKNITACVGELAETFTPSDTGDMGEVDAISKATSDADPKASTTPDATAGATKDTGDGSAAPDASSGATQHGGRDDADEDGYDKDNKDDKDHGDDGDNIDDAKKPPINSDGSRDMPQRGAPSEGDFSAKTFAENAFTPSEEIVTFSVGSGVISRQNGGHADEAGIGDIQVGSILEVTLKGGKAVSVKILVQ